MLFFLFASLLCRGRRTLTGRGQREVERMKQSVYLLAVCALLLSDRLHTCCGSPLSEKDEFKTTRFKEGLGVMTVTNIQNNGSDYFTADVNAKFNVPVS